MKHWDLRQKVQMKQVSSLIAVVCNNDAIQCAKQYERDNEHL